MNSNIKIIGLGGMGANVIASRYPAKNIRGVHWILNKYRIILVYIYRPCKIFCVNG